MTNFAQRIKDLESRLEKASSRLRTITQESLKLRDQNLQEIKVKEKELEEWRDKLEVLQQERNQIKKEMREKVLQLERSQLSNSEKQTKISHLLTKHSQELEEVDNLLYEERSHYRQIRNKLIGKLCEPCQSCQAKEQSLKYKNQKINYLLGII